LMESRAEHVLIDTEKGVDVSLGEVQQTLVTEDQPPPRVESAPTAAPRHVATENEIERAGKILSQTRAAVASMFSEVRMGRALDADHARPMVEEIANSIARNSGAIISLARLKNKDDYTYMHSAAVCALMISLARQLGLGEAETRDAGLAGLLHDIGKMAVTDTVLNKPGKLTDDEFTLVKSHPEEGHKILMASHNVTPAALDVCLHHHEKVDGSGYPHRLKDDQISLFAKMGAVCDVYDAITSDRPYKKGWDPGESLRKMNEWCKGHFDETIFRAFVKSIGIYPIGTLVRLGSGRLAVVLDQGSGSLLTPTVKVFFSTRSRERLRPEIIDLAAPRVGEKIVSVENEAEWGLENVDTLWR
jgi:putative nucleotidyltransferase with HDIG domain